MDWEFKSFEQLSVHDLYDLLKLRVDVFVVEQACPYPELDEKDRDPGILHLLGRNTERTLSAYLRILPPGLSYKDVSLGRVVVSNENRGQGTCNYMMKMALQKIDEIWPKQNIQIGAQEYLKGFYESLEFKTISDSYLEDGIPHIDMVKYWS